MTIRESKRLNYKDAIAEGAFRIRDELHNPIYTALRPSDSDAAMTAAAVRVIQMVEWQCGMPWEAILDVCRRPPTVRPEPKGPHTAAEQKRRNYDMVDDQAEHAEKMAQDPITKANREFGMHVNKALSERTDGWKL